MTYAVWQPVPPNDDLGLLTDAERRILYEGKYCRAVWSLQAIQTSLSSEAPLTVIATTKAHQEMLERLSWSLNTHGRQFLAALSKGRYQWSEWCYTPKGHTPHACDVYVMGFNRHTGEENQQLQPWVYAKFGFIGPAFNKLAFFSAHPEGQYTEYDT